MIFKSNPFDIEIPDFVASLFRSLYQASSLECQEYYAGIYGRITSGLLTIEGLIAIRHGSFTRYRRDTAAIKMSVGHLAASGKCYVGDWHCHPSALSEPSESDLGVLKNNPVKDPLLIVTGREGHTVYTRFGGDLVLVSHFE